jgi:hypothetical protein
MILQIVFLVLAIGSIVVLLFIESNRICFQSSAAYMAYIWCMLLFISGAIFFALKGTKRLVVIIPMAIVSIVLAFVSQLNEDAPWIDKEKVTIDHLKNDDRVAVTYCIGNGATVNCSHFLAESYFSDALYKRVSPDYPMNLDSGDPNLKNYELPSHYEKGDQSHLFIVEDESLLVDTQKGVCIKIRKKDNR